VAGKTAHECQVRQRRNKKNEYEKQGEMTGDKCNTSTRLNGVQ